MESIGEYAALVSQATALNQTEFEEKAQEEQANVEKQQSNNAAIEGVIAPFGIEAIKGAGGKFFKKAIKNTVSKKVQDAADLAKRFKEDPRGVTEELYKKYQQSATDRTPNEGGGIKDFIQRTLNGGRSNQPPPEDEEPAGRGTPDNNPQNTNDARNTNPDDEVPDTTGPTQPPAPPAVEEPLSTPSAPLANTAASEGDAAATSGEFDDIVANIARGGQSSLEGVLQGSVRSISSRLGTQLRPADVPSSIDANTIRGLSSARPPPPPAQPTGGGGPATQPKPPATGDGDPSPSSAIRNGEANINNESNVDAIANQTERTVAGDTERAVAGQVEKKTFEQGVKDALIANTADLENPVGDVVELGLGIASLFGALFGTKVHHQNVAAQVQQVNPNIGFGIKQQ
tara:strand:+ start:29 stop:1231 length:1203 start_codon:yes stop_codon:yes gene_type:complete